MGHKPVACSRLSDPVQGSKNSWFKKRRIFVDLNGISGFLSDFYRNFYYYYNGSKLQINFLLHNNVSDNIVCCVTVTGNGCSLNLLTFIAKIN